MAKYGESRGPRADNRPPLMNARSLRVLVVDDAVIFRKIVSSVLGELPDVEVVGTASNGKIAMSKIVSLKPDLLTLDIEMPEMNGLEVLQNMKREAPEVGAIMLSSLTRKGSDMTLKALELGAYDFIPKPQAGGMMENRKAIKEALAPMLKAFSRRKEIRLILSGKTSLQETRTGEGPASVSEDAVQRMKPVTARSGARSEIVGIGISTGGPKALAQMMPRLPSDLGVPILIVQHMPPVFTQSLADSLNSKCGLDIREASDGEAVRPNTAFIAPGGKQMKVASGAHGEGRIIRITDDPPENSCKPSVDYLFRSMAYHYAGRATGVIMTGMGSDGTLGLRLMKQNGSTVIAQDEATCAVYGMPREPIESGIVDVVAPLERIAEEICRTVKGPG